MDKASSLPTTSDQLTSAERLMLLLPLISAAVFGLLAFIFTGGFASLLGYSGNDRYIYRLLGAATFGYAVALGGGLMANSWAAVRLVVIANLVFGVALIYVAGRAILAGGAAAIIYLVLVLALISIAISAYLLYSHRTPAASPDVAQWVLIVTGVATVLALVFGLAPLIASGTFGRLFGYRVSDVPIFRAAGAATLGYGVMGIFQLMSRNWGEFRWPAVMAVVFNGMAFIASAYSIYKSSENSLADPIGLPVLVGLASLGVAIASLLALQRNGK